jgi:predicted regulator of Ras-like GTPase activity (Roadblock/LC7/MglB family)
MKKPGPADVQRWSDEVARDPRSLAFLPLARAYRRRGLRDAAIHLCLRGLEHHPANVEGHSVLALLYLERGEQQKAADEWSMVLRMDPDNFEALRGMGFCYLEQDRLSRARQMLERAALMRPADPAVQEALDLLGDRHERQRSGDQALSDDPWADHSESQAPATTVSRTQAVAEEESAEGGDRGDSRSGGSADEGPADERSAERSADVPETAGLEMRAGAALGEEPARAAPSPGNVHTSALPRDPAALFDELLDGGPLLGVLLVDAQGLVHAGRLTESVAGDAVVLGAVLGGAIGEAARTAAHLSLGEWRGIQLEAEHALLHLAPAGGDAVVLLAARRSAPAGWVLRSAAQAVEVAGRYLEVYQ